jgi:hypothetical protein
MREEDDGIGWCAECGTPYEVADLRRVVGFRTPYLCRWHFTRRDGRG